MTSPSRYRSLKKRWLDDLPIGRKLMMLMVLLVGISLSLGATISLVSRRDTIQIQLSERFLSLSKVIGRSCVTSVTIRDSDAAKKTLADLEAEPLVRHAWLFDGDGVVLGKYSAEGARDVQTPVPQKPGAYYRDSGEVDAFQLVEVEFGRRGTICIRGSTEEALDRDFQDTIDLSVKSFVLLLALAVLLSAIFSRVVTCPVTALADTARIVSADGDYSVRVTKYSNDEIGFLADNFNAMFEKIEERDLELEQANRDLGQANRDLGQANRDLEQANIDLEQSNRDLDIFAYTVSHDLREPMRGISQQTSRLIKSCADRLRDDENQRLNRIVTLMGRFNDFIDSLLQLSRVGRDFRRQDLDFGVIVHDVEQRLETFLEDSKVSFNVNGILAKISCNREGAIEILQNLIVNGVKYNSKKERRIEVGWVRYENLKCQRNPILHPQPELTVFYVRDNGDGIPEKDYERVFGIFTRLHSREKEGGTGIGLAIVKRWVERHGGVIWIESRLGEGTTFYFTLQDCA